MTVLKHVWVQIALLPSALARGSEWGIYSRNVRAYVRTYVSVTLRNVNLRYRLGMSIWGHARYVNLRSRPGRISPDTYITRRSQDDISCRWRTGRTARLALRNVRICGAKCINECWTQPTAADSGWEKTKKQRSQPTVESQESDRRTRKSSKVESTYWRFFASQVFRLTLHVTVVLWTPLLNEQHLTPAPRAPSAHGAWSGARHHAHA